MQKIGTITVPAGQSKNNTTTVVPFTIQLSASGFRLLTADADLFYEFRAGGSTSTLSTSATAGVPLVANIQRDEVSPGGGPVILAVSSVAGGSVGVWSLP